MHAAHVLPSSASTSITRTLLVLWSLFWLLMIIIAVQDYGRSPHATVWEPVLWEGSSGVVASVWLWLQRRVDARYSAYLHEPAKWFAHHYKWMPLVFVTFIPAIYAIRHVIYGLVGTTYEHEPWGYIAFYEGIKLVLFAGLWLGIVFGLNSFAAWREQRERILTLQKSLAEAQLAQLRSQLQPHFLFNALNTISALMHTSINRADELLARLSELLRASLQMQAHEFHSLAAEVHLLELYARIMQARFGDRVTLQWDIAADVRSAAVPVMLLQPLLENAFRHGVECSRGPATIHVVAQRQGASMIIMVRNTAGGGTANAGTGLGLANTRERLRLAYGAEAALDLTPGVTDFTATVRVPWQTP